MKKETVQKDYTHVLSKSHLLLLVLFSYCCMSKGKKTIVAKTLQQKRVEITPIFPSHFKYVPIYVNNYWAVLFTEEVSFTVTHSP